PSPSASSATPADAVRAQAVSYSYGDTDAREARHPALDGVSFLIPKGSYTTIVGQTGSGKSTLLRLLCALEVPDAGQLIVDGIDTLDRKRRRLLHGRVGYVMQHPERQLFAETVLEDVAYGPINMGLAKSEVALRCRQALQLVGLSGREDASPFHLSGGQQRLCALAGVLAMEPHILVLDEPMAGLDPHGRAQLRSIIRNVNELGVTVIQVTHSMDDAAASNQVIVLNEGKVLLQGTPDQVFSAQTQQILHDNGLGLPNALRFSLELERLGVEVGNTLTTDQLVQALAPLLLDSGGEEASHGV
ncbi:MAG: energy-coupling factor transporter ATPase, partial [Atopobiaceae bacterium]|nr:energy-coupling factor transporter ATPase [Atopobiaceae bacterium]